MAQEEAKRAEEAERKKAALAALNVKQGPKTGKISRPSSWAIGNEWLNTEIEDHQK